MRRKSQRFPFSQSPSRPPALPIFSHLEPLLEIDTARKRDTKDGAEEGTHQQPMYYCAREHAL